MRYPRPTNQYKFNRKKKYFIILPDSTIDNGQDIELDCNDTGSEAIKRILAKSTFIVRFAQ
jgi:hypothetical protein